MSDPEPTKIFYDAECGFCRAATGLVLAWDRRGRLTPVPLQDPAATDLLGGLSELERMASAHLVTPQGERSSGGDAVAPLLDQLPRGSRLAALSRRFPAQCRGAYGFVAGRRDLLIKLVPAAARRAADREIERRAVAPAPSGEAASPPPPTEQRAIPNERESLGPDRAVDPHRVLNTPVGDPDPTEWPDPFDRREDPRDPPDPDGAMFGEEPHPVPGSLSTSEPPASEDPEAEELREKRSRDKLE